MGQQPSTLYRDVGPRTPGGQLAAVETVAIVPVSTKPVLDILGDYGKKTPSAGEGAASATGEIMGELMFEDPRAILLAPIILPIAAIAGAASAQVRKQVQEFRDELTVDVAETVDREAPSIVLADVLQTRMQRVPRVESTLLSADDAIPDGVNAVLEIDVSSLIVDVEGDNATITTLVTAILRDPSDPMPIFRRYYEYSVKEDLGRWARNDYELLRDYSNGARQYLTRQISDEFFDKIRLRHVLRPVESGKKETLAWELILLGEEKRYAWANAISETDASYDLEIFDGSNLVFFAHDIRATEIGLPGELAPCTTFRWTVRPSYHFEGVARAGDWMAHESATRRMYSGSPAGSYGASRLAIREMTEGYPEFKTRCR